MAKTLAQLVKEYLAQPLQDDFAVYRHPRCHIYNYKTH